MKYTNGIKEINVTKGAYSDIYKDMGFYPVMEYVEKEERVMVRATNGKQEVLTSQAEFEAVYQRRGYELLDDSMGVTKAQVAGEAEKSLKELRAIAKEKGVKGYSKLNEAELLEALNALAALNAGGEGDGHEPGAEPSPEAETEPAGE